MKNILTFNASTEVSSNFTDVKYIKSKFFARYIDTYSKKLQLECSLSGGIINNLLERQPLMVNDTFYLKNFKGVRNIGYHYDR